MAHINTVDDPTTMPELAPVFERMEAVMGFVPNSILTMARVPGLSGAFSGLAGPILRNDLVEPGLVQMIAMAASTAAGSRYCQAHTIRAAERYGAEAEQLAHVWDYATHPAFSEAERAALDFARAASVVPNGVDAPVQAALRRHWDEGEIVELLGVIALFGYLNRWNDSMATTLEDPAETSGETWLGNHGWVRGKHQ